MQKIDLKKRFQPLYSTRRAYHRVTSDRSQYLAVRGRGEPGGTEYQKAMEKIFSVAYTLKFSLKNAGVLDFSVPSPETRYFDDPGEVGMENLRWEVLIRIPEEVSEGQIFDAKKAAGEKKEFDLSDLQRVEIEEGTCIQTLHIGPYEQLGQTYKKLEEYLMDQELTCAGPPHEVYLNDPRRSKPENLKTVVRIPIRA